jgi:hypothetical protein
MKKVAQRAVTPRERELAAVTGFRSSFCSAVVIYTTACLYYLC